MMLPPGNRGGKKIHRSQPACIVCLTVLLKDQSQCFETPGGYLGPAACDFGK